MEKIRAWQEVKASTNIHPQSHDIQDHQKNYILDTLYTQ